MFILNYQDNILYLDSFTIHTDLDFLKQLQLKAKVDNEIKMKLAASDHQTQDFEFLIYDNNIILHPI